MISGIVTYYVFWQTVQYYRKKDLQDSSHQQEVKELSIKPYIVARKSDEQTIGHILANERVFRIQIDKVKRDQSQNPDEFDKMNNVEKIVSFFEIENVGLGTAIEVDFDHPQSSGKSSEVDFICLTMDKRKLSCCR